MSIYSEPAASVLAGNRVVTTAGTQVQLVTTPTPCVWVKITAAPANTAGITVGDATNVDPTADAEFGATIVKGTTETFHVRDASVLWIDAVTSGDECGYRQGLVEFIPLALLAAVLLLREWQFSKERDRLAAERDKIVAFAERTAERDASERSDLLTRIQAPKDAPFVLSMTGEKQHVGLEDEDAFWENDREMNGGG